MTFLDTVPQDWTRPELTELRDLFVLAYRRPSAAQELADRAGLSPGMFPLYDNMRAIWRELIVQLGNEAKLRSLVEKARDDPAAAAYHPRFEEMLADRPSVKTPQPLDAAETWWKGDDQAPGVAARLYPERLMERRSRLLQITLAAGVVEAARSVAKLSLRFGDARAHGTGFVIGKDLLLTNHHNVVHPDHGDVTAIDAEFDYQEEFTGKPLVRKAVVESVVADEQDDWAVVRLASKVDRAPLKLGTPYTIGVDDTVVIIQHPNGAYKQFALEPLAIRHVDDARVQYLADTQQGSSGSPVFNVRMHVVALHHAEAEATVDVDGRTETLWRNQGIHVAKVMSGLEEHDVPFSVNE